MSKFVFEMWFKREGAPDQCVARGEASATMTYEFQRAFWATVAYAESASEDKLTGKFATLKSMLSRKLGENEAWVVNRGFEKFRFEATKVED